MVLSTKSTRSLSRSSVSFHSIFIFGVCNGERLNMCTIQYGGRLNGAAAAGAGLKSYMEQKTIFFVVVVFILSFFLFVHTATSPTYTLTHSLVHLQHPYIKSIAKYKARTDYVGLPLSFELRLCTWSAFTQRICIVMLVFVSRIHTKMVEIFSASPHYTSHMNGIHSKCRLFSVKLHWIYSDFLVEFVKKKCNYLQNNNSFKFMYIEMSNHNCDTTKCIWRSKSDLLT